MDSTIHWFTTAFDGLVAFFPSLIAGLVILLVGYIVARVLGGVTRRLARRLGFPRLVSRLGIGGQHEREESPSWLGRAVFLVVMLATVLQASRAWHLDFVANGLANIVAYLPHVLAASLVLGLALYIGNWVRARLSRPDVTGVVAFIPPAVRIAIIGVGAFMALRELQIAPEIVNAAFILTLGAVAVAGALAFGLGGRDVASKIAASWYERRSKGNGGMLGARTREAGM